MPQVRPLRGLGYALDRFSASALPDRIRFLGERGATAPGHRVADLTDLACPPYDVISGSQQAALLARHARNAVRLELSAEVNPHAAAAATLAAWQADGTLVRRSEPAIYDYRHATRAAPDLPTVHGTLARLRLEAWGPRIQRHEHTLPGPRADRLRLLRATRTQLSPILVVYLDPDAPAPDDSGSPVEAWRARDADGLLHTLTPRPPEPDRLERLAAQRLVVADGHHRYETALAYQAELRADPRHAAAPPGGLGADWIMVVLVNAAHEAVEIRPTHRLVREVEPDLLRGLVSDPGPLWQALPMAPEDLTARLAQLGDAATPAFGLILPRNEGWLLVGDADGLADRMRRAPGSDALHGLDLSVLHTALLEDRLRIGPEIVAAGEALAYTRSEAEARAAVAAGEARAALLVRPTRLDQLAAVASAGEVMPQKSTYFYPKLLTGLVFHPLEG